MKLHGVCIGLALWATAASAVAYEPSSMIDPRLLGVWQGSRGDAAISVCIDATVDAGRYVVHGKGEPIALVPLGKDEFAESGGVSAQWQLSVEASGRLRGTVTAKTGAAVALDLVAVDGIGEPAACAKESMVSTTRQPLHVVAGAALSKGPHRYRELHLGWQKTLEILDASPAATAVNHQLLDVMDRSGQASENVFDIRRRMLTTTDPVGYDEVNVEPLLWESHWLTVEFYRWADGTGKSGISIGRRTWNLDTGKRVDLWSWFGSAETYPDDPFAAGLGPMPAQLHALAFKAEPAPDDSDECSGNDQPGAQFQISLGSKGMDFVQPATGDGCDLAFSIGYAQLLRAATPDGAKAIRRIMQEGL